MLDALVGDNASEDTRELPQMLRDGELDDKEIEMEVPDTGGTGMPTFESRACPGRRWA